MFKISFRQLENVISNTFLSSDGDSEEKRYWHYLNEDFPNYEKFWQQFVVPLTKRIELPKGNPERIRIREEISEELEDINMAHYSVFINIIQAHKRLETQDYSNFEDFYVHLGSVCDLSEDFLLKMYFLTNACKNRHSKIIQELSEDEFLSIAKNYYKNNYKKAYEYYQRKSRMPIIKIPDIPDILSDFFEENNAKGAYSSYKAFSQEIRQYRNVIVHCPQIGSIFLDDGTKMVPKKKKIGNYDTWRKVFAAARSPRTLREDFISPHLQMNNDLRDLKRLINSLWDTVLLNINNLQHEKNYLLLQNLDLVE